MISFLQILQKHTLSKEHFKKLIDARDFKLTATKFINMDSVEKYAENSVSPVFYLLLESINVADGNVKEFASHVGKAQGIVTLIRSVRHNAQKETLILPDDFKRMISEVADKATEHAEKVVKKKI